MCPRMGLHHHWGNLNSWARAFTTFSTSAQPPELFTARKTESIGPRVRIQMTAEPRSLVIMFHLLIDFFHSFFPYTANFHLPNGDTMRKKVRKGEREKKKERNIVISGSFKTRTTCQVFEKSWGLPPFQMRGKLFRTFTGEWKNPEERTTKCGIGFISEEIHLISFHFMRK